MTSFSINRNYKYLNNQTIKHTIHKFCKTVAIKLNTISFLLIFKDFSALFQIDEISSAVFASDICNTEVSQFFNLFV